MRSYLESHGAEPPLFFDEIDIETRLPAGMMQLSASFTSPVMRHGGVNRTIQISLSANAPLTRRVRTIKFNLQSESDQGHCHGCSVDAHWYDRSEFESFRW
jgi:hypothetical protein